MLYIDSIIVKKEELFSNTDMSGGDIELAFRVPEDAETALLMLLNSEEVEFNIKSADSVFGGKDLKFLCGENSFSMFVDLNTFIQRSGEYKGCVLLEADTENFECKLLIPEK